MSNIGLVILAAGGSRRMGQPKQLLPFRGRSLIRHTAEIAIASNCHSVLVIIGAYAELVRSQLIDLPLEIAENPDWSIGLSTSIRLGIQTLQKRESEAAILTLCDQPFISTALINQLIHTYRTQNQFIVATTYADSSGVPALFHRSLFPSLCTLEGDTGAKKLLQQAASIPFPQGHIDVDTLQDWQNLCSEEKT